MSNDAEHGHGSEFWLGDAGATLTKIARLKTVPIPDGETPLIDVSDMDSVGFRDYIAGPLKDGEEVDLEMHWLPGSDTDDLCRDAVNAIRDFRINCPTAAGTYRFEGQVLVRRYTRNNPMEEGRTGVLKVKWVGDVTESLVP